MIIEKYDTKPENINNMVHNMLDKSMTRRTRIKKALKVLEKRVSSNLTPRSKSWDWEQAAKAAIAMEESRIQLARTFIERKTEDEK